MTEGRQGDIPWVSGGVGINEREYLQKMASEFNLKLEFAASDGSYLADVNATVLTRLMVIPCCRPSRPAPGS